MERHMELLIKLCRLCGGMKSVGGGRRNPVDKCGLYIARWILRAFNIDVKKDNAQIHPPFICDLCRVKMRKWWKTVQKNMKATLNINIHEFKPHSEPCEVCSSKLPLVDINKPKVRHGKFFTVEDSASTDYVKVTMADRIPVRLKVYQDFTWSLTVHGNAVSSHPLLDFPDVLDNGSLENLLNKLDSLSICCGNDFEEDIESEDSNDTVAFKNIQGETIAFKEIGFGKDCIRHVACELLVQEGRCSVCTKFQEDSCIVEME